MHSGHVTSLTRSYAEGEPGQGFQPNTSSQVRSHGHLHSTHPAHHPDQQLMYPPPSHTGPPMVDHGPYAPHHVYHTQSYLYPNLHMTNQNTRKKSVRASQACDKCRERKSRCDEQRPCATCKEQSLECHYKDSQPSKIDKGNAQLADAIEKSNEQNLQLIEQMKMMNEQMRAMTERIGTLEDSMGPSSSAATKRDAVSCQPSRNDTPATNNDRQLRGTRFLEDPSSPSSTDDFDYAEHTTAAHKLVRWPSIYKLLRRNQRPETYPLEAEDRGVLHLYGRGDQKIREDAVAIGAVSPAQSMGSDDFGLSPDLPNNIRLHGELGRPCAEPVYPLEMDSATLRHLYDRYEKHIHRMHPFLDIGKYVRWFINKYSTDSVRYLHSPISVNGFQDGQRTGAKRKMSELGTASSCGSDGGSKRSRLQPEKPKRTVINAIVYLVFALGKVCQAHHISGPLSPTEKNGSAEHCVSGASPLAMKPSPSSPLSATVSYTPPAGGREGYFVESRRSSFQDSPNMGKRQVNNIDIIPGLDYYREAVGILGDFSDANDLASAQARLLAALYKGQLGRVQESYSWLHLASRTCQYRIRIEGLNRTLDSPMEFDKTKQLTLLAYWSCLQLESDILAELDYPHSGSAAMEGKVPWPHQGVDMESVYPPAKALDTNLFITCYFAQLFLRRLLNEIHIQIYNVDLASQDPKNLSDSLERLDSTLQGFRTSEPRWDDHEAPHEDIVVARLRAKYYGARYVTTRPFLDYALHVMEKVRQGHRLEDITLNAKGEVRKQELVLFKAISRMSEETIKRKVRICIASAMKSTAALDAVKDHRLIVTNIMGTAHAQFGNILVLAATYTSPIEWLSQLVTREALGHYLERTIRFLKKIEASSATACIDHEILIELQQNLGLTKDYYQPNAFVVDGPLT